MEEKWSYFIDVSTSNTGIVLVNDKKIIITSIPFSKIKLTSTEKNEKLVEKFRGCRKMLDEIIEKYPPSETIVMEGIFINRKFVNSSETLLKFHGFLIHYFLDKHIEYIPPSNIKKAITGKGNANKIDVQESIISTWNIAFDDTDQSDAFGLYVTWMKNKGMENQGEKIEWEKIEEKKIEVKKYKEMIEERQGE